MMKKGFPAIAIALLFTLCGRGVKGDERTRIFEDYLRERFQKEVPDSRVYYLIVPHGCQGAIVKNLRELDPSLLRKERSMTIVSNEKALSYLQLSREEVLMDREGELDRLALPFHGLSLVITRKGKVQRILSDKHCKGDMGERIEALLRKSGEKSRD